MYTLLLLTALIIPDGSLIFLEHSNSIVENNTGSTMTHVGIIINNYVYEADKPKVHKITLDAFKQKNKKYKIYILSPTKQYSDQEVQNIKDYLEDQLKRRYSIWSYILGKDIKGIHCGELVATALVRSGRYQYDQPWNVVPGILWNIKNYQIYKSELSSTFTSCSYQ